MCRANSAAHIWDRSRGVSRCVRVTNFPQHSPTCTPMDSYTDQNLLFQMNWLYLYLTISWSLVGVQTVPMPEKAKRKGRFQPNKFAFLPKAPPSLPVLPWWYVSTLIPLPNLCHLPSCSLPRLKNWMLSLLPN